MASALKNFFLLFLCAAAPLRLMAQTAVLFPLAQMTGTTNDTTLTIRPVNNPVQFHSQIYWLPTAGIQLRTTNGSATTNLIPNDYTVTIAGVPGSWNISVSDTNVTLNAAEIGNLTTFTFLGPPFGVQQILAGANVTVSPANGKGIVTVSSTGGSGGTASNAFVTVAGNSLVNVSSNFGTLTFTISGVSQTNGYPWGVLYDAVGTARSATNGYPWGVLYDAAGAAQAATNGLSIASGLAAFRGTNTFAPTNVATASQVGLVKPDGSTITIGSDGTISATTGGGGNMLAANNLSDVASKPIALANLGGASTNYGTTLEVRFANGAFMRTNTTPPFSWEFRNTNGTITLGTNAVTKLTFTKDGILSLVNTLSVVGPSGTEFHLNLDSDANSGDWVFQNVGVDQMMLHSAVNGDALLFDGQNDHIAIQSGWGWLGEAGGLTDLNGANIQSNTIPRSMADSSWASIVNPGLFGGSSNILRFVSNNVAGAPVFQPDKESASGGGGSATGLTSSNYLAQSTNLFIWDVSKVQRLLTRFNTNITTMVLSNAWYLTNGVAQWDTWEDTNGVWKIANLLTSGGLTRTNGTKWRGTNASQYDIATVRLDLTGTNAVVSFGDTNVQPTISFTNSLAGGGGGGGGGGGTYSLVTHSTGNGGSAGTTTGVDTTGANLIVISASWFGASGSITDSKGNTWTALAAHGDTSGNYSNQLYYCISPTVGASHTFTLTASFAVINVQAFTLSSGTPAFDTQNGLNGTTSAITTLQPGSVTPAGNNELIITGFASNDAGGGDATPATIDSSFTITDQAKQGSNASYGGAAYLIQTTGAAVNPTWTFAHNINADSASIAAFK